MIVREDSRCLGNWPEAATDDKDRVQKPLWWNGGDGGVEHWARVCRQVNRQRQMEIRAGVISSCETENLKGDFYIGNKLEERGPLRGWAQMPPTDKSRIQKKVSQMCRWCRRPGARDHVSCCFHNYGQCDFTLPLLRDWKLRLFINV